MNDDNFICKKCGKNVYPGDEICMNCGSKLNLYNMVKFKKEEKQRVNTICVIVGILFLILVVGLVIYYII